MRAALAARADSRAVASLRRYRPRPVSGTEAENGSTSCHRAVQLFQNSSPVTGISPTSMTRYPSPTAGAATKLAPWVAAGATSRRYVAEAAVTLSPAQRDRTQRPVKSAPWPGK